MISALRWDHLPMPQRGRVVWKYEDEEDDGTPFGPVWIDYFGDDPVKPERSEELDRWVTLAEARQIAEELGFDLLEDS